MAKYRKIDTRIWNDRKFNSLSDDAKYLFIYILAHQNLTSIGAVRTSLAGLSGELCWELDRTKNAFAEITNLKLVQFDDKSFLLWLPNFLKYNKPESPNVVRSWAQSLDYLPECDLKDELISKIFLFVSSMSKSYVEALPQAFRKGLPNQEQEQEQELEQEQERDRARGCATLRSKKSLSLEDLNNKSKNQSEYSEQAIEVLEFLNQKANKCFEPIKENLVEIIERLKQGETVEICRSLIVKKARSWLGDKNMDSNLNPITLFKKTNYYRYKGELVAPV